MVRTAVIVLGVLLPFVANAQAVRLKGYLYPENDAFRALDEVYLAGAMDALTAYNMAAPIKLFCKEGEIVSDGEGRDYWLYADPVAANPVKTRSLD